MIKRVIEVLNPAHLKLGQSQLIIEQDLIETGRIPIEDLGVLIISNPSIVMTQQVIIACQKNNVAIIFCDEKYQPLSVLLPLAGHSLHTKILQNQIKISLPVKKQIWKQLVEAKIATQVQTLQLTSNKAESLIKLSKKIKSGDPDNIEAQAAKLYWPLLFDKNFRRNIDDEGINAYLNYGYAIIRSAVARAICIAGLHPALGVYHRNQYNPLCLADDLMEPFRGWVDHCVHQLSPSIIPGEFPIAHKKTLLELLSRPSQVENTSMPFMVSLVQYVGSYKKSLEGSIKKLSIPIAIL